MPTRGMHIVLLTGLLIVSPTRGAEPDVNAYDLAMKTGVAAFEKRDWKQAERAFRQAVTIGEKFGEDSERLARSLDHLATVYSVQQQYEQAAPVYERSLAILEKRYDKFDPHLSQTLHNLATVYRTLEKYDKAAELFDRQVKIAKVEHGEDDLKVAAALDNLAIVDGMRKQYDKAAEGFAQALAIRKTKLGDDHMKVAITHKNLGAACKGLNDYDAAREHYEQLLKIVKNKQPLSSEHIEALSLLAETYERTKRNPAPLYSEMITIIEAKEGENAVNLTRPLYLLAQAYSANQQLNKAEQTLKRALKINIKHRGEAHEEVGKIEFSLAVVNFHLKQYREAETHSKKAIAILQKTVGPRHPLYAYAVLNYAAVLEQTGRADQAKQLRELVERLQEKVQEEGNP